MPPVSPRYDATMTRHTPSLRQRLLSWLLLPAAAGLLTLMLLPAGSAAPIAAALYPTATPFVQPAGCRQPLDDYTRVWVGDAQLNTRTLSMLNQAQRLYRAAGGTLDLRRAIAQGSYNPGVVAASFGTHDGGGAVDISVRSPVTWEVLYDEIDPLLAALRTAGFAAWLRDTGSLYPGSPIHIHAIAIGDAELSPAARGQVDGPFGYLRGFNGLPQTSGIPVLDPHGPPVICRWMVLMGFEDMRGQAGGSIQFNIDGTRRRFGHELSTTTAGAR